MSGTRGYAACLGLILLCTQATAQSQPLTSPRLPGWPMPIPANDQPVAGVIRRAPLAEVVPLAEIAVRVRDQVRNVIEQPTLSGSGPPEEFSGKFGIYLWLLDHPDRAAKAWRQLGAPCVDIASRGEGRFSWNDKNGSDVNWETVHRGPTKHVWYAEGTVRPGMMFPSLPVRAVVVVHHQDRLDSQGRPQIKHHADVFVQTDSKAAALLVRLFGPSVPRITEQCLGQLEMFFSAMTNYVHRHPEKAQELLK